MSSLRSHPRPWMTTADGQTHSPCPLALGLTFACARQMGRGLLDVSFVLNKQGGGAGPELITAQVKSSQFAFVFYLQTRSIALPRSVALGVRAGRLQAFGLSFKKKKKKKCDMFIKVRTSVYTPGAQLILGEKSLTLPLKQTRSQPNLITKMKKIPGNRWENEGSPNGCSILRAPE